MALSWNEIKTRAIEFSKEWENDFNEHAEAKSFMDAFFNVFGISRKRVGTFEQNVRKEDGKQGFIDFLWKGVILIEFKSRGKNLEKAHTQAKDYFSGIKESELPKYILVCDFQRFRLYDLEEDTTVEFTLSELVQNVQHFGYLLGYQKKVYKEQDPANIKAAELMGKLHDRLEEIGYTGHALEVYLVRILFCLFAEDTTIFNKQQFQDFIEQRTNEDGSDLAPKLQELFQVLNTDKPFRFKNLDEQLAEFPYVNGKLFEEILPTASFDSKMRQSLLDCCYLDWSKISPAIFGSMFQSVMNPKERRNLGAHYTSETNILKLIKPLFLDELWKEFESIKNNRKQLQEFHEKLSQLKFLDPACGCGNFLVITYRELRLLEIEILRALRKSGQAVLNVSDIIWLDVDMMCGIEFEEFPARIAEVAMWLIDHQMNMQISNEFGQYFVRLPLKKSAKIIHGNALQIDWQDVIETDKPHGADSISQSLKATNIIASGETRRTDMENFSVPEGDKLLIDSSTLSGSESSFADNVGFHPTLLNKSLSGIKDSENTYIMGNPPFIGSKMMTQEQRDSIVREFENIQGSGVLDYVTGWYAKAAKYIQGTKIKVGFVSTNSIVQGEQVSVLWGQLLNKYNIKIHFAHRTFKWSNEAKGNAAVYCVIIGFANFDTANKTIYEYENIKGEAHAIKVLNINPYLVDAKDILINKRVNPICNVPQISKGNQPTDGGHLLLDDDEKAELIKINPESEKFIKRLIGAREYIHNINRWCLWLVDASPAELRSMSAIVERMKRVQKMRVESTDPKTRELANTPWLFRETRNYNSFIIVPSVTSENRRYIPMGFGDKSIIPTNLVLIIPNGNLFHFGILTSAMHMAWVKNICGRLKSDFRYSKDIVYNNYPFPENPSEKQIKAIETAAQKVLDARAEFPNSSLADLYDPLTMPPSLVKAHNELDKAVDLAYRPQAFTSEANRMVFLFELYEKYTANLFTETKKKKGK